MNESEVQKGRAVEFETSVTATLRGEVVWRGDNGVVIELSGSDPRPPAAARIDADVAKLYSKQDFTGRSVVWIGAAHFRTLRVP